MEELIKGNGSIYNSKFRSSTSNTISMKFREPIYSRLNTPGPGAYQTFSEFGIYRSKYADKMEKEEMRRTQKQFRSTSRKLSKCNSMGNLDSNMKLNKGN